MSIQPRILLSLDETEDTFLARKMLKSPLELSQILIKSLFNRDFEKIRDKLDSIKSFVAGIDRAEFLGNEYKIANFYSHFFAFHQFFHSSYRARQGKVLEEIIKAVIRSVSNDFEVADAAKDKIELISRAFLGYNSKLDLDVVAANKNDILAIQIRSRDDTGGTTAKGSLVDALRKMLSYEENSAGKITYLIGIWDIINSNQKQITKDKIFANLEKSIKVSKGEFVENIENGIALSESVFVKMCYGLDSLIVEIQSWTGNDYFLDINFVKEQIELLTLSDDLWLSYLVTSLELENIELNRLDNITYLNKLLSEEEYETEGFVSSAQYLNLADELAQRILPKWREKLTFLNLNSPAEIVCYVRDLILLKFVYDKIS